MSCLRDRAGCRIRSRDRFSGREMTPTGRTGNTPALLGIKSWVSSKHSEGYARMTNRLLRGRFEEHGHTRESADRELHGRLWTKWRAGLHGVLRDRLCL